MDRYELRSKIKELLSTNFTTEEEIDDIIGEIRKLIENNCEAKFDFDIKDELIEILK